MRNYIDLISEAPIGDIHRSEFSDTESSYKKDDQGIIKSPKAEVKWRHLFRNTPYTIDIAFMETRSRYVFTSGAYDYASVRDQFERNGRGILSPPSRPDSIMMVFTYNDGADRYPLSGWIIAHRMAHAIDVRGGPVHGCFYDVQDIIDEVVEKLSAWEIKALSGTMALGRMKSCRDRVINSYSEFKYELFAQFIIAGKVTMNRLSDRTEFYEKQGGITSTGKAGIEKINPLIDECEQKLNAIFVDIMDKLKGLVVVL